MLWFIQKRIPLNLHFLEQKMRQTAHYSEPHQLTKQHFFSLLYDRIDTLDINHAKADIAPFTQRPEVIDGWSKAVFRAAANQIIFGV
jgi:hypothetical protein